jgi:hypothetical protein
VLVSWLWDGSRCGARKCRGRAGDEVPLGAAVEAVPDPKPAYVADWPDLPHWQQQTDADIFEHIERDVADSPAS